MRYLPSDETPPDSPGLFKISPVFVFIKVFTKLFAFYFVRNLQIFQANLYKKFHFFLWRCLESSDIFITISYGFWKSQWICKNGFSIQFRGVMRRWRFWMVAMLASALHLMTINLAHYKRFGFICNECNKIARMEFTNYCVVDVRSYNNFFQKTISYVSGQHNRNQVVRLCVIMDQITCTFSILWSKYLLHLLYTNKWELYFSVKYLHIYNFC